MSIKRYQTKVKIDNETILYKVRTEFDKNESIDKEHLRMQTLQVILGSAESWNCGPGKFDKMTIFYENGGWVVVTEYTERLST